MTEPKRAPTTANDLELRRAALEGSINILKQFGVIIPESSRLHSACATIAGVISHGEFPTDPPEITELVNALEIAEDFSSIASHLPPNRQTDIRLQLNEAVKGTLAALEDDRAPFRYQSQYWIRSVLIDAGLNPTIPLDTTRENPDFLISPLTILYGAEVKRPMYGKNLASNIEKAASQLSSYSLDGCVFIDVSDCIREQGSDWANNEVRRYSQVADELIWDDERQEHRPGYHHVILVATISRGTWIYRSKPIPTVDRENHVAVKTYAHRYGTTAYYAAQKMKNVILQAMRGADMSVTIVAQ